MISTSFLESVFSRSAFLRIYKAVPKIERYDKNPINPAFINHSMKILWARSIHTPSQSIGIGLTVYIAIKFSWPHPRTGRSFIPFHAIFHVSKRVLAESLEIIEVNRERV
ncbi:hypothetical protein BMS3Bbin09_00006 [bacterium BMS3Bbin09]|nr:hypothetical protein BMS3Bbin09_00006 [bacterium BMS3Bbin09]